MIKVKIFGPIYIFLLLVHLSLSAQPPDPDGDPNNDGGTELGGFGPCLQGGITFTLQEQVDSFKMNFPTCNRIEGNVNIYGSDINSLDSLENITSIGGSLEISTDLLTDLNGLNRLEAIEGYFSLQGNLSLADLDALDSLRLIAGNVFIDGNPSLKSIAGIENVDNSFINDLTITYNDSLTDCQAQAICDYLSNPTGRIRIAYNATGCANPPQIANNCGITLPCLPYGDYILYTQQQIDSFSLNYPNCSHLQGFVRIRSNLENLFGLSEIKVIQGELDIESTIGLNDLSGLDSLKYVAQSLNIWENELTNLDGLFNLDTIGGSLWIKDNYNLTTLHGIDSLAYLGGTLNISGNQNLSVCDVVSICNYLVDPIGVINIENNATGCDSQQEVEEACTVSVDEQVGQPEVRVYPNPFFEEATIEYELKQPQKTTITIFNHLGEPVKLITKPGLKGIQQVTWNADDQPPGVYFYTIRSGNYIRTGKLLLIN